jgi:hypothetical protein
VLLLLLLPPPPSPPPPLLPLLVTVQEMVTLMVCVSVGGGRVSVALWEELALTVWEREGSLLGLPLPLLLGHSEPRPLGLGLVE